MWWPDWPVVAAGVDLEAPAAVVRANRVLARTPAAAREGVRAGMRRREAQSACPALELIVHDPDRDRRAFDPVVQAVAELVPLVEVADPGRLAFTTRGPSRYHGGDEALAALTHHTALHALAGALGPGVGPGVGIADGRLAAGVAARRSVRAGTPLVVASGVAATAAYLAPLPVGVLVEVAEVPAELVDLLGRLGLRRLGDVAALSTPDLLARFGALGAQVHAMACGLDDAPLGVGPPPPDLAATSHFDEPVERLDTVVFLVRGLADQLVAALGDRGLVCTRLVVEVETEHGERSQRAWARPTGLSAGAMLERVRWQLEGWATAGTLTGGVVLVRLVPDEVRADHGHQGGLWGGQTQADEWAARAVARVSGLLGPDAVTVAEWRGGRHPGEQYVAVPAGAVDPDERAARVRPDPRCGGDSWPGRLPAPSPAWVHATPVPAQLVDEHGRSLRVSGRGELSAPPARLVVGDRPARVVVAWAGPWPLEERWWDPQRRRRAARLQVVTDDATAYLAVVEGGSWWVSAVYS
jgi:protein ImuB